MAKRAATQPGAERPRGHAHQPTGPIASMVMKWDAKDVSIWLDTMSLGHLKPFLRGMTGSDLLAATPRALATVGVKSRHVSVSLPDLRASNCHVIGDVLHVLTASSFLSGHVFVQAEMLLAARRQLFRGGTTTDADAREKNHHRPEGRRRVAILRRPRSVEAFDPLRMRWPEATDSTHATKRRTFVIKE